MNIQLRQVKLEDREILSNLLEKYNYEFSQYDNRDVNKLGLYGYQYLDYYWTEKNRWAYFIEGEFDIEFDDGLTHLCEGDFIIIPKGTSHRPVCKSLIKCLLIEIDGTLNKNNTGGTYKTSAKALQI